jgi:hypothetical protein
MDHIFFSCPLAEFAWSLIGEALGWEGYLRSMQELVTTWLSGKFRVSYQIGLACFVALACAIWLTRNNICIRKKFPNKTWGCHSPGVVFCSEMENLDDG